ncbi:MAG: hypothetical protein QXU65_06790 [Sulfolobales archaeon]
MSVSVSIKVRRELADKTAEYGIAGSRSHAFNIMIEKGLTEVTREVEYRDGIYRRIEEL